MAMWILSQPLSIPPFSHSMDWPQQSFGNTRFLLPKQLAPLFLATSTMIMSQTLWWNTTRDRASQFTTTPRRRCWTGQMASPCWSAWFWTLVARTVCWAALRCRSRWVVISFYTGKHSAKDVRFQARRTSLFLVTTDSNFCNFQLLSINILQTVILYSSLGQTPANCGTIPRAFFSYQPSPDTFNHLEPFSSAPKIWCCS